MNKNDLLKVLNTPIDLASKNLNEQAGLLALHFAGMIAKPTGLSEQIYEKCLEARNKSLPKIEREEEAIYKVLLENKN